ncbi:MAG: hypothetical protein K6A43_09540 [Treponema sp.]|nr:hypothetical protein [Treponema sp.]
MKKLIIAGMILALSSVMCLSAEEAAEPKKALEAKNGVGASYYSPDFNNLGLNNFLGGLCYQHWFTDRIGLEVGGAVTWTPSDNQDPLYYNIYAEGDFVLYSSELSKYFASRLYAWTILGHTGTTTSEYVPAVYADDDYTHPVTESYYKDPVFAPNFRAGLGFGFDIIIYRHISIPLKFGFTGSLTGAGFTFGGGIKYIW